jgi:hypothetical protein
MMTPMGLRTPSLLVLTALLLLSGCDRAKSPKAAANDISEAKQSAAQELADAQAQAAKDVNAASLDAQAKSLKLARANATAASELALAKADGDHKVAIQQCLALDGIAQRTCKDQADLKYEAARGDAKATRAAN